MPTTPNKRLAQLNTPVCYIRLERLATRPVRQPGYPWLMEIIGWAILATLLTVILLIGGR